MANVLSPWYALTAAVGNIFRTRGTQSPAPSGYSAPSPAPVTLETAMQVSAFWACVRLIAETIGSLPFVMYERSGDVRVASDHPLALLFADKVNRYQSRQEFFETLALNLATSGNAYTLIQRLGTKIIGLLPLMSGQVEVKSLEGGGLAYCYVEDGVVRVFSEENVWHLKLFGNGVIGLSPLAYARNSVGMAIAGETRTGKLWANGGKPSGVLLIDKLLTEPQRDQMRNEFKGLREGNVDELMVLEAGAKYETISLSPQDMELLDSRRFQIEDIARFLGVPSVLINDTSATTVWGSGISQIVAGWYKLGLRPYLERFQTGAKLKLLTPAERQKYEFEFDFRALLRIDPKDHMATLTQGVGSGLLTRNEARVELGKAPMTGADELTVQVNLTPIELLGAATNVTNKPQE
jgi:HK97 family phage portal protein